MVSDRTPDYPPETETGLIELKVLLAKELGLDLNSLGEDQQVTFGSLPTAPRFTGTPWRHRHSSGPRRVTLPPLC